MKTIKWIGLNENTGKVESNITSAEFELYLLEFTQVLSETLPVPDEIWVLDDPRFAGCHRVTSIQSLLDTIRKWPINYCVWAGINPLTGDLVISGRPNKG